MSLDRVAVFPLPGVHLFPHALLPLHVFEPRYRALLKDCLAGDRRMLIAPIIESTQPGEAAADVPEIHRVCGLGVIVEHVPLPDGRANILLRGTGRVRVVSEHPRIDAYRTVRATALSDEVAADFAAAAATRMLHLLVDEVARRLPSGGDTLRELARVQTEAGALADVLASAVVTDVAERQRLMETLDVQERVERVGAELAQLLRRLSKSTESN